MAANHTVEVKQTGRFRYGELLHLTRRDTPELLDCGVGTQDDVATNLAEMWRLNTYFGGVKAVTDYLYPCISQVDAPIAVLDLGTGAAQLLRTIAEWGRANGQALRFIGVDWAARNLAVARRSVAGFPEIALLHADALNPPYGDNSVDYVISSLFIHHLKPEQVIQLLSLSYRVARRGIVMSDLIRGWLPLIGFKLIQPFFARHFLTRHDGALSIRRAYTPEEMRELAHAAGLGQAQIYKRWPSHMALVASK
jgi:ubiquinone/menaquinone biosynthesis C-methylase UbiE